MEAHSHINQDSGITEYYTDSFILSLARKVLKKIDLDPASNSVANKNVGAITFFSKEDNGLSKQWFGKVWMNHPFAKGEKACKKNCKKKNCKPSTDPKKPTRGHCITSDIPSNAQWTNKLANEYHSGNIEEAICITFSSMSESWMEPLVAQLQCFPRGRINYFNSQGEKLKSVTKGSVITYFGKNQEEFRKVFSEIGTVK